MNPSVVLWIFILVTMIPNKSQCGIVFFHVSYYDIHVFFLLVLWSSGQVWRTAWPCWTLAAAGGQLLSTLQKSLKTPGRSDFLHCKNIFQQLNIFWQHIKYYTKIFLDKVFPKFTKGYIYFHTFFISFITFLLFFLPHCVFNCLYFLCAGCAHCQIPDFKRSTSTQWPSKFCSQCILMQCIL